MTTRYALYAGIAFFGYVAAAPESAVPAEWRFWAGAISSTLLAVKALQSKPETNGETKLEKTSTQQVENAEMK